MSNWTLFSNHGHVLVCLARDPESRLRDVAADVGITERAVQKIVRDLQDGGMVSVTKQGRRNRYKIHNNQALRHDLEAHCTLGQLIRLVNKSLPPSDEPEETQQAVARPDASPPARPQVDEPEQSRPALARLETAKPGPVKTEKVQEKSPKADKSKAENSIEKQQGSLF